MATKEQILADLPEADREQITASLKVWQEEGAENPQIPLGDVDGDGQVDAWALDADGNLTLVTAPLEETVYVSEGDGIEQGGIPEGAE